MNSADNRTDLEEKSSNNEEKRNEKANKGKEKAEKGKNNRGKGKSKKEKGERHSDDNDDDDDDDDSPVSTDHSSFAYDEPHEYWDKFGNLPGCGCWACAVFGGIDLLSILRVDEWEGVMICEQDPWMLTSEPEFIQGFPTI